MSKLEMTQGFTRRVVSSLTIVTLVAFGNGVAAAASRPDLVPTGPKAATTAAVAGGALAVSAKIKNTGSGNSGRTKTAFYLSKDALKNKGDVLIGKKATAAVPAGGAKTVRLAGTVPAATKPAFYRVLACADAATQVRESNEVNNCKASAGKNEIIAAYDPTPFGPVEPVSVDPVVDAGSSVTTRVSAADGGEVSLALPSGTTFTLDVPAGALTTDEDITMTALSDIANDPFGGGFVAGVKLEPEGLEFEETALLTIHPASPITPSEETPFSAESSGDGFHLYPVMIRPPDPTFPIMHFTLVGLFRASDVQRTAQVERSAVDPEAAFNQQLADIISQARQRYFLEGGDGSYTDAEFKRLVNIGRRFYDVVVRPLLVDASNAQKCASFGEKKRAIRTALSWARQMILLFGDGADIMEGMEGRISRMYDLIQKVAVAPCEFPTTWTGEMSGSLAKNGFVETWGGTVTFTKSFDDGTLASYNVTAGSLQWEVSGTDSGGCTYSGSRTLEASGEGSLSTYSDSYRFRVNRATFLATVTKDCPNSPPEEVGFTTLNADFGSTDAQPWEAGQTTAAGSRTYNPSDFPSATAVLNWSLQAGS